MSLEVTFLVWQKFSHVFVVWRGKWWNVYLSVRFFNSCCRLPETKCHSSLFLHWSGSKFLAVMAACTPSIHIFLGRLLFFSPLVKWNILKKKKYRRGKKKSILCMIWNSFQEVRRELFSYWLLKPVLILQNIVLATLWSSFFIFSPLSFMSSFSTQMTAPTDFWKLWGISNCCIKGLSLRPCNKSSLIYNSNKK